MDKTTEMIALEMSRDALAAALAEEARLDAEHDAAKKAWEKEHETLITTRKATRERVENLRAVVQFNAIKVWEGDKRPKLTEGIGVQLRTQVEYDPLTLREALLKYAPMFLVVDEKAIKALGESAANKTPLMSSIMPVLPIKIFDQPTPTIGDETLIKLHAMKQADQVVEQAMSAAQIVPTPPVVEDLTGAIETAVAAVAAALEVVS